MDDCEAAPIPCINDCALERTYADAEDVLDLTLRTRERDRDLLPPPTTLTFTLPKEERNERGDDGGSGLEVVSEETTLEWD